MALTLLEIVQDVTAEIGLDSPSAVVGNTENQIRQLRALTNRVGRSLTREYEWRRLTKEHIFETTAPINFTGDVAGKVVTNIATTAALSPGMLVTGPNVKTWTEIATVDGPNQVTLNITPTAGGLTIPLSFLTQDYPLPADFDRQISNTSWDRSNFWPNSGSKSSQEWGWLKGGVISTGPRFRFRIYRNATRITPAPLGSIVQAYEYVSQNWVVATGEANASKAKMTLDTDTAIYPDDLMVLGIKFQWYRSKGLDWAEPLAEFSRAISHCKGQDKALPALSLSPTDAPLLISPYNIQESNYNL